MALTTRPPVLSDRTARTNASPSASVGGSIVSPSFVLAPTTNKCPGPMFALSVTVSPLALSLAALLCCTTVGAEVLLVEVCVSARSTS